MKVKKKKKVVHSPNSLLFCIFHCRMIRQVDTFIKFLFPQCAASVKRFKLHFLIANLQQSAAGQLPSAYDACEKNKI